MLVPDVVMPRKANVTGRNQAVSIKLFSKNTEISTAPLNPIFIPWKQEDYHLVRTETKHISAYMSPWRVCAYTLCCIGRKLKENCRRKKTA
jgi:hypothetical protein